uniref:Peptidase S26 domain-containing protein n=1 Tax=Dendroctonus ponderosae TaxID=77166 RepID=A0AAR5QFB9_DENPD
MKKGLFKLLGSLGYLVQYDCVVHCTFEYLGDFVLCSGPSMEPTIYSNDILFTEHLSALIVPIGHIWIQGDNVSNSTDSRSYGPVPLGLVRSKAVCKVWPPSSISMLSGS